MEKYKKTVKKKNKLKIIAPRWHDEFGLPDGSFSVSDIQDYLEYIIKEHETLRSIPPIHVYVSLISNRLVFKIKDGYNLERKNGENLPSLK